MSDGGDISASDTQSACSNVAGKLTIKLGSTPNSRNKRKAPASVLSPVDEKLLKILSEPDNDDDLFGKTVANFLRRMPPKKIVWREWSLKN